MRHGTQRGDLRRSPLSAAVVLVAVVAPWLACSATSSPRAGEGTSSTSVVPAPIPACDGPGDCPLRTLAEEGDLLVGTAVDWELLDDPVYADTVAREFNSVTPERELKWDVLQPQPGAWNFEPADHIVRFAQRNDIAVKGHTLVWAQAITDSTPDWVEQIDDPEELRAVLQEHISTVIEHYSGAVDRWDVVNEPLETVGTELYGNHFHEVLGPGYIAEAFRMAHAADPEVRLFLNENVVEYLPEKRAALVDLVAGLVDDGVPIHGVGLQMHLLGGAPEVTAVADMVESLTSLGLEVAITEMDVPINAETSLDVQARTYAQVLGECLASRCWDITFWGFTDAHSWIDQFMEPGLRPLLLDEQYRPKPSYDAAWTELRR